MILLQHPEKWTAILLSMTPIAAECLLDCWDQLKPTVGAVCTTSERTVAETERIDSQLLDRFFVGIFAPCGDRVSEVTLAVVVC